MRMRDVRNRLVFLGVLATAGFVAYHLLLTEEARSSLKGAVGTVQDSYHRASEAIEGTKGIVMDEGKVALPNREHTAAQWAALGF